MSLNVIVRTSTARVVPGRLPEFAAYILAAVQEFPTRNPGLLSHDVLLDHENNEVVYLSRWKDEQSLIAFAGPGWRSDAVLLPGEAEYLLAPLAVRHYRSVPIPSVDDAVL